MTRSALFLLALLAVSAPAEAQRARGRPTDQLAWMAGCWEERRANGVRVEETWTVPRAGLLIGTSRTTRPFAHGAPDSLVAYETVLLQERRGALVYLARPSGQAEASFTADTVRAGLAVFSNPAHDFPRRIRYAASGTDSLHATLEGPGPRGTRRFVRYRYARVPCAPVERR